MHRQLFLAKRTNLNFFNGFEYDPTGVWEEAMAGVECGRYQVVCPQGTRLDGDYRSYKVGTDAVAKRGIQYRERYKEENS